MLNPNKPRHFPRKIILCVFFSLLAALFLSVAATADDETPPEVQEEAPPDATVLTEEKGASEGENQVITAEDILNMKVTKLEDVLNLVPGISASSSSLSIHGSYKVRVFLDGTPLNDPTSSYGAVNFAHIPLGSIERIVVMKGSGGLRYGQDATAGVVLIESKGLKAEKFSGQLRAMAGNYQFKKADADLSLNLGKFGINIRGGREQDKGYKINNDSKLDSYGLRLSYHMAPKKAIRLVYDEMLEKSGLSGLPDFPTPFSRMETRNLSASLGLEFLGFTNKLYINQGQVKNDDPTRNLHSYLEVTEMGDSASYEMDFSWGTAALGAGYTKIEASSLDFGEKSENTTHFFGDVSFKVPKLPLMMTAGLRYNLNSGFQDSLNPELSLSYSKGKLEATYKLSYGVNTPSFQQRYTHTSSTDPNPELGVEKVLNHSLSFNYQAHKSLSLNSSFFLNTLNGRISYVRDLNVGVGSYENLGKTVYKGFDFGANFKPSPKFELKANYSYILARDEDINRFLTSIPRYKTTAEVILKPTDAFTLAFKANYQGKTFLDRDNTRTLGGRTLYYLRLEYKLKALTFFMDMDNVFDKEYYYIDGLLAPPLKYYLGVKYDL
ncbi:MAG: TonB-dependent receptor plug domain-containing protein [Deltaproteobacteria bacterium]|jgi:iron complex outermembrane receptor protein|nr:TonB-dependent receptor plug domain-containing protein [Deltaproteobacteria bacterium]